MARDMTAGELRALLADLPDHTPVRMESATGSEPHPVADVAPAQVEWVGSIALIRYGDRR